MQMTAQQLDDVIRQWGLNAAQAARVLCLHSNKMSEYLGEISRIPCAVAFHIDALNRLPKQEQQQVFVQRIERESHETLTLSFQKSKAGSG